MSLSPLRVLLAAELHKKERFHLFDRATASKRMRNRQYYSRNKARIKAHRRLYRLKHKYHNKVDQGIMAIRPSWATKTHHPSARPHHPSKPSVALSPSAPKIRRFSLGPRP